MIGKARNNLFRMISVPNEENGTMEAAAKGIRLKYFKDTRFQSVLTHGNACNGNPFAL